MTAMDNVELLQKAPEIAEALRRMKVETGSLVCLGCGYEHKCSRLGCRVLRMAALIIDTLSLEAAGEMAESATTKGENEHGA